jgi:hypothetical protein
VIERLRWRTKIYECLQEFESQVTPVEDLLRHL